MAFEPFINNAGDEKDKKNGRRLRIHALYSNSIAASGMWFFTSIRAIWLKSNLYLGYRIDQLLIGLSASCVWNRLDCLSLISWRSARNSLDHPDLSSLNTYRRASGLIVLKKCWRYLSEAYRNFGKRYDWTKEHLHDNHAPKQVQKYLQWCHLLHFYKISVICLGMYWNCTVYLEMPKTFFITIKKILRCSNAP